MELTIGIPLGRFHKHKHMSALRSEPQSRLQRAEEPVQKTGEVGEVAYFGFGKAGQSLSEEFDAVGAGSVHKLSSFAGGLEEETASVFRDLTANEARTLEVGDDAAHGRRADLFGVGEFA